ncbi:MAG: thiamine pyrophosphate-binding protein [Gemmatimonadetes bacterium]|nr:thiamine pyrophosphate-binding protein [Gemmatimonadota bacterium]
MQSSGAEIVVRALEDEGIPFAFGIPGTHNIELYDALAESEKVRPVLVTDEQSASFMADAVWRASGKLGCVNLVPGAGLTHALSGIAEAFMDTVPMLVLGCGIRHDSGMGYQLHDVDQLAMARPVTKAVLRPERGEEIYATIRRACRIAREGAPGPVMVEIPANLYLSQHDVGDDTVPAPVPLPVPDRTDIERAAALLSRSRRPLLYLGLGAAGAGAKLVELAERLEAPVATTFQGKGVFPESHPLFLWNGYGRAAPPFARDIASSCDATLALGCRFGEVATGSYGAPPPGRLVHVDIEPAVLGRNYPAEVAIAADAALFVDALQQALPKRTSTAPGTGTATELRKRIREGHEKVWAEWLEEKGGPKVTPAYFLRSLQQAFGADTIYTTDSGNGTFLAVECLRLDGPGKFLAPVDYSCMGYSVPAAIGAKLARPAAPVVAIAGDGAFLMTGLELVTAATLKLPIAVFVLRDWQLAQIAQLQEAAYARAPASTLGNYDLDILCHGLGVECLRMDSDDEVAPMLKRVSSMLDEGRPVAVDVSIDYAEKTYFTRGVIRTNLGRLPLIDRIRFLSRALARRVFA